MSTLLNNNGDTDVIMQDRDTIDQSPSKAATSEISNPDDTNASVGEKDGAVSTEVEGTIAVLDVETKPEFSIDESTANQAQDNSLPLLANSSSVANEVEGVNETQQSVLEDNALHMEKEPISGSSAEKVDEPEHRQIEPELEIKHTEDKREDIINEAEIKAKPEAEPEEKPEKHVLPKWMVEDANAPPSPEQEANTETPSELGVSEPKSEEGKTHARGRGRKPKSTAVDMAKLDINVNQAQETSQRPRRSTRTRIDYANPDAGTVVAEFDDELCGSDTKKKSLRGRKRKASESEEIDDGDNSSDYDSKKSAKRRTATKKVVQPAGVKRGRGRPAGSGRNKGRGPGRPKKNKATEEVSDDADGEGEVVYNDHVSEKEHSDEEEIYDVEKESQAHRQMKSNSLVQKVTTPSSSQTAPAPKKRGRPPRKAIEKPATVAEEKTSANQLGEIPAS